MPDEFSEAANRVLADLADARMLVPPLFWFEIANVLITNERRKRIGKEQVYAAVEMILGLPHETSESRPDMSAVMDIARAKNLTAYDATYLELAMRTGSTLATLDNSLAKAAISEGIPVISRLD